MTPGVDEGGAGSGPSGGAGPGPKPPYPPSKAAAWPTRGRLVAEVSVHVTTVPLAPPGVVVRELAPTIWAREAENAGRPPSRYLPTARAALVRLL